MTRGPVVIPEKIYFKIGEVCELVDVQAHVLRYWETEFPQLTPQKNRSGQRSYRRKDVETALRIKELLYDEMYTIAGARKKLQHEQRENGKVKNGEPPVQAPALGDSGLFDAEIEHHAADDRPTSNGTPELTADARDALRTLAAQLLELREMLKTSQTAEASEHLRNRPV